MQIYLLLAKHNVSMQLIQWLAETKYSKEEREIWNSDLKESVFMPPYGFHKLQINLTEIKKCETEIRVHD